MDYADVFSKKLAAELPKCSNINKHAITLKLGKQLPYSPIYNFGPMECKTFKTYIEINLANDFIYPSKSLVRASILVIRKTDRSLRLCIDYRGLNNPIIKNWYALPFISKLLNRLSQAIYPIWSYERISSNEDQRRRWAKDNF